MYLQVFRYIQSEILVGAISTRRFLCVQKWELNVPQEAKNEKRYGSVIDN